MSTSQLPSDEAWLTIPDSLAASCQKTPEGAAWLERLPGALRELRARWSLQVEGPYDSPDVTASWVAPVSRPDGRSAVLKLGLPHMEADHESDGLRYWDGDPTVFLIDSDDALNALLLERCVPGTSLRRESEPNQDVVIADLLRRLWRTPGQVSPFRPLSTMLATWSNQTLKQQRDWPDPGLVRDGLGLFSDLAASSPEDVVLATDLHAGNVLRAEREPWLVIDPKPFVGDSAYDATQHLLNCPDRMRQDPIGTVNRFTGLLGLDAERVRLWMFARTAAEPRDVWVDDDRWLLARALAP